MDAADHHKRGRNLSYISAVLAAGGGEVQPVPAKGIKLRTVSLRCHSRRFAGVGGGRGGHRLKLLVAYDITEDQRRERMSRILLDYGQRVQGSVFWLDID